MNKKLIMFCMCLGSIVGGYLPNLWGDSGLLSFTSIIFSAIGGFLGIYAGYKIGEDY